MSNHRVCEHRTPPSAMADGGQAPRAPLPEPVFVCAPGTARRPTSPSARLVVPSSPGSTLAVTLTVASLIPCTSPHASVHAPTVPCSACLPCCCSSTSAAPQPRARPCSCRPSSVHWPLSAPASRSTAPDTETDAAATQYDYGVDDPSLLPEQPDDGAQDPDATVHDESYYTGGTYYYVQPADDDQE
ncbi:hypothetical protein ACQJBY_015489 [Aegilops geniculata]